MVIANVTRRWFLCGALLIVGMALALVWSFRALSEYMVRALQPRLDTSRPPGSLSSDELASVVAYAEILVEGRVLPDPDRAYLAEHINHRTRQQPGYFALYRTTARLVDRLAGRPFGPLELAERLSVVTRHTLLPTLERPALQELLLHRDEVTVRTLATTDLIWGYYASPRGWSINGYAVPRGECNSLARYTRSEA